MNLLQLYNHLPITIEEDKDGIYIVSCAALGFYTYGKSATEGIGNLEKAVEMCRVSFNFLLLGIGWLFTVLIKLLLRVVRKTKSKF